MRRARSSLRSLPAVASIILSRAEFLGVRFAIGAQANLVIDGLARLRRPHGGYQRIHQRLMARDMNPSAWYTPRWRSGSFGR